MFTGIIDHNGEITKVVKRKNSDITITVSTKFKTKDIVHPPIGKPELLQVEYLWS